LSLINYIKNFINLFKIDIIKYPNIDLRRRKKLFDHNGINLILDVGANSGQYALQNFKIGFSGKIISFEPVSDVYAVLKKKVVKNKNWTAYNYGLGNEEIELPINISKNTYSSSILDIMPSHVIGAPESKYTHKETITIKTLDTVFENIVEKGDVVLLKLDVQGYEKLVLDGATESLNKIKGVQIEMSIQELYKNELLYDEIISFLKSKGFNLSSLENGFYNNKTGELLQVDGIFLKNKM
jgi:FkbM family methyltransferase